MSNRIVALLSTLALCILLFSCASSPKKETMPIPSRPSSSTSTSKTKALPKNVAVRPRRLSLLEPVFRTQRKINQIDDLYATTKGKVSNLSIVYNCDLDVLKGFVANSYAPVVLLVSPVGGKHLWAVAGYDDDAKKVQLKNPANRSTRNLDYSDFENEWKRGSDQKCALVTPMRVNKTKIHSILEEYLPSMKANQVGVRSR